MTKLPAQLSAALVASGAVLTCASDGFAADTHVIKTDGFAWTYKDKRSTPAVPVAIDDLKVGDTVEVQIADDGIDHGFVTIKRAAGTAPQPDPTRVQACGESKPDAVLREIDCGTAGSQFAHKFIGTMRLEILSTFKDPVDFYCTEHKAGMPGTLKLSP